LYYSRQVDNIAVVAAAVAYAVAIGCGANKGSNNWYFVAVSQPYVVIVSGDVGLLLKVLLLYRAHGYHRRQFRDSGRLQLTFEQGCEWL
jgi:ABC-type arginine/histidine transport system permease subunit